jgi:hypothetical protein
LHRLSKEICVTFSGKYTYDNDEKLFSHFGGLDSAHNDRESPSEGSRCSESGEERRCRDIDSRMYAPMTSADRKPSSPQESSDVPRRSPAGAMSSADDRPLNLSSKPQSSSRRRVAATSGQISHQHGHHRQRNTAVGKVSPARARISSPGAVKAENRANMYVDGRLYAERDTSKREDMIETTKSTPNSFPPSSPWYPTMADIVAAAAARSTAAGFPVDFTPSSSALSTSCSSSILLSQQPQHRSPFGAGETTSSWSGIDRLQIGLQMSVSLLGARATSTAWNSPLSGNPRPPPSYAERCGATPSHTLPVSPSLQAGVDRVHTTLLCNSNINGTHDIKMCSSRTQFPSNWGYFI